MPTLTAPPARGASTATPTVSNSARARADAVLVARRAAGDPRAREALIERFLPLARSIARRYENSGEPLEDLVQVASLALVKAVDRYDPGRGHAFSSFAVPTIAGELKRHFRDRTWTVRPPRDLQELAMKVDRATSELWQRHDRAPTVAELAAVLERDPEQILEALHARTARGRLSLDAHRGGDEDQPALGDVLGTVDDGFDQAESRALLDALLATVSQRDREVIRLRFEEDLTQAEIGERLGVSQMQISRIVRQTLVQLRHVADRQQRIIEQRP
ncbi:MAG: polymerase sigma-B factor [Solirubrobacteraceae bacterium]|jgi:RNA polymerase sigma-B factor|nr:polymerase sigma-B factor [Solirubrobacteraceae bacterium]